MVDSRVKELEEILKKHDGEKHLIALRGAPDPDSLSSALAHQFILAKYNIHSQIAHACRLGHEENRAHVKLLGTELVRYSKDMSFESYLGYSVVDASRPDDDFVESMGEKPIVSIVDHHDAPEGLEAEFIDIRRGVGATATIYTEYLRDLNLFANDERGRKIATALMHGIMSDTDDLLNGNQVDYEAVSYLSKFADLNLLKQISKQSLTEQTMDTIVGAYEKKKIYGSYLLAGVGVLKPGDRDALPQAADFLMQREGVHTALVYGLIGSEIDCSLRTVSDQVNPHDFLLDAFPDVETHGRYGGRFDKGGFTMRLGPVLSYLNSIKSDLVIPAVNAYMESRFEGYVGKRKDALTSNGSG